MRTSYYWKAMGHPDSVGISATVPQRFRGPRYLQLAPPIQLVRAIKAGELTFVEYEREFAQGVLAPLDPGEVYADLGDKAVLLCWEKDPTCCHRRIVARWLELHLGVAVPEL